MSVPYFRNEEIVPGTFMITNDFLKPGALNAFCYLIVGENYALLIDTMVGYGDLKAYCESLTDKPIKLVNTHYHLDHTGGNYQFDLCFIHPDDIALFYEAPFKTQEEVFSMMKANAREEYLDELSIDQVTEQKAMKVFPVTDGDIFDLGDREIEVIEVGGHTPGSIVLIDHKTRICFSGDACNSNTLLGFGSSLPIEAYLNNLLYFKKFTDEFDILYGGHQILTPEVIDEGIELCGKIIAGTDDKEQRESLGRMTFYGAKHVENGFQRADGKSFNISYNPENILDIRDDIKIIR